MKLLIKAVIVLLVALAAVIVAATIKLNTVIKTAVEAAGPKVTGVSVKLNKVGISFLKGEFSLKGLALGNPEGFSTPHSISVGRFEVKLKMASLLSDKIMIEKVLIQEPEITFEGSLKGSNISKLLERMQDGDKPDGASEAAPSGEDKKSGKKVVIKDLLIEGAQVNMSMAGLGGHAAPLPLPPIHMQNIGEESGGASIQKVVSDVVGAILKGTLGVVTGSLNLVGDGAKAVTGAAVDGAEKGAHLVSDGASNLVGGVVDLFGGEKAK